MTAVVLVDENDVAVGTAEKLHAHHPPLMLHRAFSAFLFDGDRRILLQRRSESKNHFGGLSPRATVSHTP